MEPSEHLNVSFLPNQRQFITTNLVTLKSNNVNQYHIQRCTHRQNVKYTIDTDEITDWSSDPLTSIPSLSGHHLTRNTLEVWPSNISQTYRLKWQAEKQHHTQCHLRTFSSTFTTAKLLHLKQLTRIFLITKCCRITINNHVTSKDYYSSIHVAQKQCKVCVQINTNDDNKCTTSSAHLQ